MSTDGLHHTINTKEIYQTNMTEPGKNLYYHCITTVIILIYL